MPAPINDERKATVLVDALYKGDKAAAAKHGVSERSVRRWRVDLEEGTTLSSIVQKKLLERDKSWAEEIPAALNACIGYIREAAQTVNKRDPDAIEAVTKAAATLSEIDITRGIINARLAGQNRPDSQEAG